VDLYSALS